MYSPPDIAGFDSPKEIFNLGSTGCLIRHRNFLMFIEVRSGLILFGLRTSDFSVSDIVAFRIEDLLTVSGYVRGGRRRA